MKINNQTYTQRISNSSTVKKDSINNSFSTHCKTTKTEISNSIAESLKFFVDNSDTIKFVSESTTNKNKKYMFSRDDLFKSIYHQNKFDLKREKKKYNRSSTKYFEKDLLDNKNLSGKSCNISFTTFNFRLKQSFLNNKIVHKFENLITELKVNCHDRMNYSKEESLKIKSDLEKNIEFLNLRIKQTKDEINFHKSEISEIKNDTNKIQRLNERIKSESNYINTEIPLIKEKFIKAKNEIIKNNKELSNLKSNIFNEEKQINFFQDESEILKDKISQNEKEKQKFKYEIIKYKKKVDILKENLKKENTKMNTLMKEIEYIIDNTKK